MVTDRNRLGNSGDSLVPAPSVKRPNTTRNKRVNPSAATSVTSEPEQVVGHATGQITTGGV
jgi:hypothetical protein